MPKNIAPIVWEKYFHERQRHGISDAAKRSGVSASAASRLEAGKSPNSTGHAALMRFREKHPGSIRDPKNMAKIPQRALADFAFFRLRYFGRKSTPWQVYAANLVAEAHEEARRTMERRFIVVNLPPGSGKSTIFTHDLECWLICRDRSIRILIGSATETLARSYTEQIMTTLERTEPPPLEPAQARRGAVQAEGCLLLDFGRFKPDNGRNWRTGAFKVAQENDQAATTKEATVSAFGRDSSYLGQRPDVAIWDDLVTEETSGSPDARERTLRKWQREAEQRVEPGGVLVLQGQRLFADDLYRYCIDLPADDGDDDDEGAGRKYTHIVFKAHYEEHCKGDHGKDATPYDPANPETSGCLLDPVGLSWKYLRQIQRDDETHGTSTYRIVFQQEDGDPTRSLVNPLWVEGGEDPKTGERFVGCWDHDRVAGIAPKLGPGCVSLISIDSSPSKYWAIGWWLIEPETKRRYLVDLHRAKMKTYDVLSLNTDSGMFTGLLEEWFQSAKWQGYPISRLIFEANDSEVFFLDGVEMRKWQIDRQVLVTRHKTNTNKADPNYGVQSVGPVYLHGLVRLPGDVASGSRAKMLPLVREVTRWPDTTTTDCLMQQWFVEFNMPNIARAHVELPHQDRPSWLNKLPDGRNLRLVGAR